MNKLTLVDALNSAGVAPDSYWLEGGLPSERYCLEHRVDGWAVYYSERGQRTGETVFDSEQEACDKLFSMLIADASTRYTA